MAVNPNADGLLYFSDPNQKKIFRLRRMSMPKNRHSRDLTSNIELVAGSGASCYPLQEGTHPDFIYLSLCAFCMVLHAADFYIILYNES